MRHSVGIRYADMTDVAVVTSQWRTDVWRILFCLGYIISE
jgi:hypothetical protein